MTGMIDSHTHICGTDLFPRWQRVIEDAKKNGIQRIMVVCSEAEEAKRAISIAKQESIIDIALGLHPNNALNVSKRVWDEFADLIESPAVRAVGEIGMDYYFYENVVPQVLQKELFVAQMELANRLKKPVLIHMRQAAEDTRRYMKGHLKVPGVIHCFSDDCRVMEDFLNMGMYISFSGNIIQGPESLKEAVRRVPMDKLLFESNSPSNLPAPVQRGLKEPQFLPCVVNEICRLKKADREEVIQTVYNNYMSLFPVMEP